MVLFAQLIFGVSSSLCGVNTRPLKRVEHLHASVVSCLAQTVAGSRAC